MGDLSVEDAYRKWGDELVGYATSLVGPDNAVDAVSETFALLLSAVDERWDCVIDYRGYLFRCVLNTTRMHERSASRRRDREHRNASTDSSPTMAQSPLVDPRIARAVSSLTLQQRAVIYLTYWEDLTTPQVAQMLEVTDGSVKRQLARARAKLRKALR